MGSFFLSPWKWYSKSLALFLYKIFPPVQFSSRVKMTEDELVLHFFQFDGSSFPFLIFASIGIGLLHHPWWNFPRITIVEGLLFSFLIIITADAVEDDYAVKGGLAKKSFVYPCIIWSSIYWLLVLMQSEISSYVTYGCLTFSFWISSFPFMISDSLKYRLFMVIRKCFTAEDGKGSINIKDLAKVAIAHDFTWTDSELADMIRFFDADGDGKVKIFHTVLYPFHFLVTH